MIPQIVITDREQEIDNLVVVLSKWSKLPAGLFSQAEKKYMKDQAELSKKQLISFNRYNHWVFVFLIKDEKDPFMKLESCRKAGDQAAAILNGHKAKRVALFDTENRGDETMAFAEGMALGSYQYLKHKKDRTEEPTLELIEIYSETLSDATVHGPQSTAHGSPSTAHGSPSTAHGLRSTAHASPFPLLPSKLNPVLKAVAWCRDLINEPNSHQTATTFAAEIERVATAVGVHVEILNKQKLEALKMGGILGVNRGSHEPPNMTILEWKPENAVNPKPIVLIGKGVIFDTGGMNLKPGNSMMNMKDDMSGAAAVAATLCAVAVANIPVYVVGLMPATDNRPGPLAMVPGDVLTMHDGTTVEVVDTDAEGRLLLADALAYAHRYDPALVIDLATLTGSALRAVGRHAAAGMQSGAPDELNRLMESGRRTFERIVGFPMWEEYGEYLKSEVADIKNLGPPEAGLIIAAKFLEKFTSYPYIHLDIAGPAFLEKRDSYRGSGGTGFGVRLLFDFLMSTF